MESGTASFSIGGLAKATGVGVETVRFYERQGLIKKPTKVLSGFRKYTQDDLKQIHFIKRAQQLGFSLKEVKEFLALKVNGRSTCSGMKDRTDHKIIEIESKIKDLNRMKKVLRKLSLQCSGVGSPINECPILEAFEVSESL